MFIRVRAKRLFTFFFFLVFHCPVSILLVARVSWISKSKPSSLYCTGLYCTLGKLHCVRNTLNWFAFNLIAVS